MADLVGQTIGQYQIIERLGRGGMADVYKAYHTGLAVNRALKVIRPELVAEEGFRERFQREAQAVAALRHPNIVQMHDFGVQDNLYYMVMEFLEGQDLKSYLSRHGQIRPFDQVVTIIEQVGSALDYAHQRGLIHRDIKPANIMLTADGHAILMDFGIARILTLEDRMTQTGIGIGTPAYMSPEQARALPDIAPPSDIYSLGVVLYEMLTGKVPFSADTPLAVMLKVVSDPLPSPREFSPDIPDVLQGVVLKATAKEPAQRYQTAAAMVDGLKRSLGVTTGAPIAPDPQATMISPAGSTTPGAVRPKKKKKAKQSQRTLWLIIGAVVIVLLCLGVGLAGAGFYFFGQSASSSGVTTSDTVVTNGEAIPSGQFVTGEITSPEATASHTFEATAGQIIYFQLVSSSAGAYFKLLAPDGRTEIFNVYNGDQGPVTLEQAGTYTLVVDPDGENVPTYEFAIWDVKPAVVEGGPLEFGKFVSGALNIPGQTASYTFEATAGQSVYFQVESTSEGTYFSLLAPDGRTELFNVYNTDQGPVALEQAGTYTLVVDPDAANKPKYEFVVWDADSAAAAGGPIELGKFVSGQFITPGQSASYTFEATAGQTIYFHMESSTEGSYFKLLAPDGRTEVFNVYNTDQGPVTLEQAGTYTLVVDPDAANKPKYEFVVWDVNPAVIEGGAIEFGQIVGGEMTLPGQTAGYTFEATAGQTIYFHMESSTEGSYFKLLAPDGRTEVFNVYNSDPGPVTLEQAGTYTLVVDPDTANKPKYEFIVWDVNPAVIEGGAIEFGQSVAGEITIPGQTASYTFEATAGQTINFHVESTSEGTYFNLMGPDGNTQIFSVYNSDQEAVVLDQAGSYTLIVAPDGANKPKYEFVINLQ